MRNHISFSDFSNLVLIFASSISIKSAYIESIPSDIRTAIFDNQWSNSDYNTINAILEMCMPKIIKADFDWFCEVAHSDFKNKPAIEVNGTRYVIDSVNAYLEYAKVELFDINGGLITAFKD